MSHRATPGKPGYHIERDTLPTVYNDIEFMGSRGDSHTFFKQTHFRHVPFSIQSIDVFDPFDFGKETVCILPKHASFASKMYMAFDLPELPDGCYWVNSIGHKIIDSISVFIDSQKVQTITGDWLEIHNELFTPSCHKNGVNELLCKYETTIERARHRRSQKQCIVPLKFWFCESLRQAIPLASMKHSQLRFVTKLKPLEDLVECSIGVLDGASIGPLQNTKFMVDYIFIDDDERMKFTTDTIEYNIEQMNYELLATVKAKNPVAPQISGANDTGGIFEYNLEWEGPIKYAIWTLRDKITNELISLRKAVITMNGIDLLKRTARPNSMIYQLMIPHAHNSNIPRYKLNMFSMCLNMESDVPNGSSNVNNVSDLKFVVELMPNTNLSDLTMYSVRYNVLQFKGGVGRVMFS